MSRSLDGLAGWPSQVFCQALLADCVNLARGYQFVKRLADYNR